MSRLTHVCWQALADKNKPVDIGANLFIGNLDSGVTKQHLFGTLSAFRALYSSALALCSRIHPVSGLTASKRVNGSR